MFVGSFFSFVLVHRTRIQNRAAFFRSLLRLEQRLSGRLEERLEDYLLDLFFMAHGKFFKIEGNYHIVIH
jgi:hypothetical protein